MSATPSPSRRIGRLAIALALCVGLSACNGLKRMSEIGEPPKFSEIDNPTHEKGYSPVSLPMPAPEVARRSPNSLWRPGARAFFRDQRAQRIGDILTVNVVIADEASLSSSTSATRSTDEDVDIDTLLGFETKAAKLLPKGVNPAQLLDIDSTSTNSGNGSIDREEDIELKLAALIVQVLPNGNMVIHGRQEVRVNHEMREVQVAGIIRPEDISSTNTIDYDKIAEARIAYGGRGTISDLQQPRWGTQVLDVILPF